MISVYDKKDNCCGCTACEHICPTGAIKMTSDEEGFLYPEIDQILCIDCGKCRMVCAFQNGYDKSNNLVTPDAYGAKHVNDDVRMESRSGGVFTALSDHVFENGGIIYGAGFDNNFKVCHKKAVNEYERNSFRGSKYVQSDLNIVFADIETELKTGIKVMFSGTPCQTAGLKEFLSMRKAPTQELLICDLICHGVPSPKLFRDYLDYLENKNRSSISNFNFRDKKLFGWKEHRESFTINKKSINSRRYTNLFYENSSLRPSCYNCKYTNLIRPSDITLADFWGVDDIIDGFNDNNGVSLIFINTDKGRKVFVKVKEEVITKECTGAAFIHPNLVKPTDRPPHREQFWKDYQTRGFKYISKRYGGYDAISIMRKKIKSILNKIGLIK